MSHMSLYGALDSLNPQRLILLLENVKDPIKLNEMMNEKIFANLTINYIGVVSNCNSLLYLLSNMINTFEDEDIDDMRRMLIILINKADRNVLTETDSMRNNILHYLAVLNDIELIRMIIEKGVEVCVNSQLKLPHHYSKNEKCKIILMNWSKIRSHRKKDILCAKESSSSEENLANDCENPMKQRISNTNVDTLVSIYDQSIERKIIEENNGIGLSNKKHTNHFISNIDLNKKKETSMENYQIKKIDIDGIYEKKCYEIATEEVKINKYPGKLFISTHNIVGFFNQNPNIESIFLRIFVNDIVKNSRRYSPDSNLDFEDIFVFNLDEPDAKIKIFLVAEFSENLFFKKEIRKILQSKVLYITKNNIDRCHNVFLQHDFEWKQYVSNNILRSIKDRFIKLPTATLLKTHLAYISNEELAFLNYEQIESTKSLIRWLIYRKNSYIMWFRGYAHIRGNWRMVTHLWKRRFIQWHGYKIILFNEFSGVMVGKIDLSNAKFYCDENSKNTIKVIMIEGTIEILYETESAFNAGKTAFENCIGALAND